MIGLAPTFLRVIGAREKSRQKTGVRIELGAPVKHVKSGG